jgi:hypothetical protein
LVTLGPVGIGVGPRQVTEIFWHQGTSAPELSRRALERFRAQDGRGELFMIEGDGGHLDGLFEIGQAAEAIRRFIDSD